jgi:HEAT repeat protein
VRDSFTSSQTADEVRRAERIESLVQAGVAGVSELVAMLDEPSWLLRRQVVSALASLGDVAAASLAEVIANQRSHEGRLAAAVDALSASAAPLADGHALALAESDNPAVVADAAAVLGRRRCRSAVLVLADLAKHPNDIVAVAALEALGRIGGRAAVATLVAAVESDNFFRVFPAIDVLGRSGDPRAVQPLVDLLGDPRYALEATRALGRTGDRSAVDALVPRLGADSESMVRITAMALRDLSDRHALRFGVDEIDSMIASLFDETLVGRLARVLNGADSAEAVAICHVLGASGRESAAEALTPLLEGENEVAEAAGRALRRLGRATQDRMLKMLREGSSEQRRALLPLVPARYGDAEHVAACLDDPDPQVRTLACDALARIGNPVVARRLFALLSDPHPGVAHATVGALQSLGSHEVEELVVEAARTGSARVRRFALRIIGYFGYESALHVVIASAGGDDEQLRESAIGALPFIERSEATEALFEAVRSEAPRTRAAAMRALANSRDERAPSHLLRGLADSDPWVRYYACRSLGRIGFTRAVDRIALLLRDESGQVRVAAIDALSHLQTEKASQALVHAAHSSDPDMRRAAIVGLGLTDAPEALPILIEAMKSDDVATRLVAVSALAGKASPEAERSVAEAAHDPDEAVRQAAISFLASTPTREATTTLAELLGNDHDERVIEALATFTPERVQALLALLDVSDDDRAPHLVTALLRMRKREATAAVERAAELENPAARKAALPALAVIGTPAALTLLESVARSDPDPEVRRIGALALAQ